MNYTKFEHQHRFAVWAAARAAQRNFTSIDMLREALEQTSLSDFAKERHTIATAEVYNKKHIDWCRKIQSFLRENGIDNATYGRAAKLVAVYLKSMIVLPFIESKQAEFIHPPIDRILLQNIAKKKGLDRRKKELLRETNWTQLDERSYFKLVKLLLEICGDEPFWKLEEYWTVTQS